MQHKMELFDHHGRHIFLWSGRAQDTACAERLARRAYDTSIAAIYRARGLTSANMAKDLAVGQVSASPQPAPNGWRITWRAAYAASEHPKKQDANMAKRVLLPLLGDAVHSDKRCLQAAAADERLEVGIWMQRIGHHGLVDVDSFVIARAAGSERTIRFANPALRDAVRVLILRSISPYHGSEGPRRGQPYQGLRFPVAGYPASARYASLRHGPFRPQSLIDWLDADGFKELADRLKASYPS
jgi:hypothetical protein